MSITLRSTKGSALTYAEADANFAGLADGSLVSYNLVTASLDGSGNVIGTVANGKTVPVVTCEGFGASSSASASTNTSAIQAALNRTGLVTLTTPGTYFWLPQPAASPAQPSILTIGSDTNFYVGPGVILQAAQGSPVSSFISNKNFLDNKTTITSWSVGSLLQSQYKVVTFTLASSKNLSVGDWVIISGDGHSGYGWDNGYRVMAVNTPGAATTFAVYVWKTDIDGLTVSALDTIYCYKADGNFSVVIDGKITTEGSTAYVASPTGPQPEMGIFAFNKVKFLTVAMRNLEHGVNAKAMTFTNWYDVEIPYANMHNVGAGITPCGPGRGMHCGIVSKEGGEDGFLIQTMTFQSATSSGYMDADGTKANGNITGIHVDHYHSQHTQFRAMSILTSDSLTDVNAPWTVDDISLSNVYYEGDVATSAFCLIQHQSVSTGGGGNIGNIHIGNFFYEDGAAATGAPGQLFYDAGVSSPRSFLYTNSIIIDNLVVGKSNTGPALGLRSKIFDVGHNLTGHTVGELAVKSGHVLIDQQNLSTALDLVFIDNTTLVRSVDIDKTRFVKRSMLQSVTLSAAGTGYTAGDILRGSAGTFITPIRIRVDTVSAGAVATFTVLDAGNYVTPPASPAVTTGGTGTGATFAFAQTIQIVRLINFGTSTNTVSLAKVTACEFDLIGNPRMFGRVPSGSAATKFIVDKCVFKNFYEIVEPASNPVLDLTILNTDMSLVTKNICDTGMGNSSTWTITLGNVTFKNTIEPISAGAGLTAIVINWRSLGGNSGLFNTGLATIANTSVAQWTMNFLGNCADLKQDFNLITPGRIDGAIVNEAGGVVGAPGAIGPGLVACFGVAAGSWKPLNPLKAANSV